MNILPNDLQPEEEFPKEEPATAASDELEEVVLEETTLEDVKEDVKPEEDQEDDAEFKLFEDRWTAGILEVYSFFGHSCGM